MLCVMTTNGQCGGFGDPDKSDMEVCALPITPELIAGLRKIEARIVAMKQEDADLAEVAYHLNFCAEWYEYEAVELIEAVAETFQDDETAFVPDDLLKDCTPCSTECERLEGWAHFKPEHGCWFTLIAYRKHCGARVTSHEFQLAELVEALSMEGVIA